MDTDIAIIKDRYARAVLALKRHNIDAWLICGRETHVTSEPALAYLVPLDLLRYTAVLLTQSGKKICVCAALESEELTDTGLFDRIIVYPAMTAFPETLANILSELTDIKTLALNFSGHDTSSDGLSHTAYQLIKNCLATANFSGSIVSASPVMKQVRGVKSPAEIAKIKAACALAMGIYEKARPQMKPGMSGMDVQRLFQRLILEAGADFSWYRNGNPFVSVGTKSSYNCKRPPSDVFIEKGDLVNVDLGIRLDGYASDNQRSFYALRDGETEPPPEIRKAFHTIQQINTEVCRAMKNGTDSNSLGEIGCKVLEQNGYAERIRSYGHEIGTFAHIGGIGAGNHPVNIDLDATLETNMTFTLEPALITSHGRLCQEEVVAVGETQGIMLSVPQREVWLI